MSQTATSPRLPLSSTRSTTTMPTLKTPRITSPHQTTAQTGSPNYFGFQANESNAFLTGSSAQHAKTNWSPATSAVGSMAAISPTVLPVEQRSEYAAFRKQSDGKVFTLGDLGAFNNSTTSGRPSLPRSKTTIPKEATAAQPTTRNRNASIGSRLEVSQSPKRMLSPGSLVAQEQSRRSTPANSEPHEHIRKPLPLEKHSMSGSAVPKPYVSSTPSDSDTESQLLPSTTLVKIIQSEEPYLLLDVRVSTQYTTSHIAGAVNLCIPTTLLKRPAFNVQKLCDTLKNDDQKAQFEQWQRCKYIIVYDNASSQLKDANATSCLNTVKKFQLEGYTGSLHILQGGFLDFSRRYPAHVELCSSSPSSSPDRQLSDNDGPEVAPVAGGCPMPRADSAANPFFGNIRQNMDLIGGVGQIALSHPQRATRDVEQHFPVWLRNAADSADRGEHVAKKFELIERREKKRMEEALSGKVAWGEPSDAGEGVRIAGLEKGSKNRYNNIYPFEHSRVKLQGVSFHSCDYFNASHIKAAWSNKRYISTQAPIPATFNDYWNVIWQQDVRVIVMLTAEQEGAQVKAHNYWQAKQYGALRLDFLSEKRASIDIEKIRRRHNRPSNGRHTTSPILAEIKDEKAGDEPYVVVRKFTLSHDSQPFERMREITQLHYSGWPDIGIPAHPTHLLGLVAQCDAVVRSTVKANTSEPAPTGQRPVLVHCSAGCGRTGTFCTVDSVIDMLKRQRASRRARATSPMDIDHTSEHKSASGNAGFFTSQGVLGGEGGDSPEGDWIYRDDLDLIEKTVEDFRVQRISMVQSLRQYVLCYESIMEWITEQELDSAIA